MMGSYFPCRLEISNNGVALTFRGRFGDLIVNARQLAKWFGAEWTIIRIRDNVIMAQSKEAV